jgi:V8-like Glu-specific endopeptidase
MDHYGEATAGPLNITIPLQGIPALKETSMKRRYQIRKGLKNLVGCALTVSLLMGAVPWTSALAADAFTDINGLRWIATGPVEYSDGPMIEPVEGADEYRAESGLVEMSLEELKAMYQPYMEIGGVQYTLSAEQVDEFATKLFQLFQVIRSHPMIGEIGPIGVDQPSQGAESRLRAADVDRDPSAGVGPEAVFGPDERYKINGQAHRQPYARIAKTWGGGSVCTAFKAYNHHTAMTAAHCVHDGPGGGWRTRHQIQFAAGSNRSGGLGLAKNPLPSGCYGRVVPGGWVSTRERQYDYAVLYLHGRGGAWCNFADYNVGYYGYKTVTGSGISGYVSGYPGASTSPNASWGDLWYAARSDASQSGNTIRHTVDASGGQSGSPFATRTDDVTSQFMGIHVAGASSYNIASRVQSAMITFIQTYAGY